MEFIKYYTCPYCNKTLDNQNLSMECNNLNEFYCDSCDKTYIIEENIIIEDMDIITEAAEQEEGDRN